MRRLVAIGMLSALFVTAGAASPAFACGCGIVVGPQEQPVDASNERAIVHWDGTKETIDLLLDLESESLTTGMIIPTPLPALVSEGDARLFDLVEGMAAPTNRVETDWWGLGYLLPDPEPENVVVLDTVTVGPIETTTLAATDTAGLDTWLAQNGFVVPEEKIKALGNYIERGWSFTVMRLTGEDALDGTIEPIRLTFETPRLVYPARLAAVETTPQSLRLYVFDKQRVTVAQAHSPTREIDGAVSVVWAGEATDSRLTPLGDYMTVFDIRYEVPKDQVTSDLTFVYSVGGADVKPETVHYRMITLLGIPVGTLIVGWVILGLAIATGHFVGRRRAR
jgi:hypothetical protein